MWYFSFELVYVVDYIDRFPYIEQSLHSWDGAYLIILDEHFDVFLALVGKNFIDYFCINIHKGNWSKVLCLVGFWSGLGTRVIVASVNDLGSGPCVCILWNSLKSVGFKSSYYYFFGGGWFFGFFFFRDRILCIALIVLKLTM